MKTLTLVCAVGVLGASVATHAAPPVRLPVAGKYLVFPVANKEAKRARVTVRVGATLVHRLECDLPADPAATSWWGWLDMSGHRGGTAELEVEASDEVRAMIRCADALPDHSGVYAEALRPQFHFSQMRGWNNDPNGMVYADGEYHLFWQSNPAGWGWCNMYWGHAVSRDLVHWTELPHALRPFGEQERDREASMAARECFSGSAAVDAANTSGWGTGGTGPMVIAFTDTGAGE